MKNNNNKAFNSHEIIEIINVSFFQYIPAIEQKKKKKKEITERKEDIDFSSIYILYLITDIFPNI